MAKYAVPYQLQVPMGGVQLTGGRFLHFLHEEP